MLNSSNYLKYKTVSFRSSSNLDIGKKYNMGLSTAVHREKSEQDRLNEEFSKAFDYKKPGNLLDAVDEILPSPAIARKNGSDNSDCSVQISEDGHVQINRTKNGKEKHLFIKGHELDPEVFTDESKRAIAEGLRFRYPWPQQLWTKHNGLDWPPSEKMLNSKVKVAAGHTDARGRESKFIENLNPGDNILGVSTKAIVSKNPKDSSVTLLVQQDNTSGQDSVAPWIVAPVRFEYSENTDNPNSLIAFPEYIEDKKNSDEFPIKNFRWDDYILDSELNSKIILANPCANGPLEEPKYIAKSTNWAFSANRGDEEVVLLRGSGVHKDHFQVYAEQQEYVDLQLTGPMVPKGQKSNVAMKVDFIPLNKLTDNKFSTFGETGNIKNEVITLAKLLKKKGIVKE